VLISSSCTLPEASVISIHREISDHDATLAHINIPISISDIFKRQVWLYKQADFVLLNELISITDWAGLFENCTIVDDACLQFTEKYLCLSKSCIPTNLVTIRPNDKPWMNSDIRKQIRCRDRLHKRFRVSGSDADLIKFKRHRNKVNNMKKYVRTHFYESV